MLACWLSSAASLAAEEFQFEIPAQQAGAALNALGQQSNQQILYLFDEVQGKTTRTVVGSYSPDAAIELMLEGTGLAAQRNDRGVLTVSLSEDESIQSGGTDMTPSRKTGLFAAVATLFTAQAGAQDDSAVTASAALEEITVSARRVEESLQDVPVAISAFTADTLERRQITSSDDIAKITPNLQFSNNAPLAGNNNSSIIFIRGVGQISPRANTDPGVGLYIDDVYMGQSVGGTMELRDIAGVQVIRGPQGTLFGRNTIGGAVLLTTTSPGDEVGGTLRLGTGEEGLIEAFAAVDLPISDTVKTRFSLGTRQQDGYVTRVADGLDLGDTNNTTFMAKMHIDPSEAFRARVSFDYTTADENGSPMVFSTLNNNTDVTANIPPTANPGWIGANQSVAAGCLDAWVKLPGPPLPEIAPGSTVIPPTPAVLPGPPLGYTAENNNPNCANDQWAAGPYANNGTFPLKSTLDNWGLSVNLEWGLSDTVTLKSITSYRDLEWRGLRDADNTPFTILHTDFASEGDQFSQELQFNYQGEGITGVAGVYYYTEEVTDVLKVYVGDRGAGVSCDDTGFTGTDRCHIDSDNNIVENDSFAVFGQLSYDFSDVLSGSLGVR